MAKTNISLITESKNYLTLEETNQIINALQNASYDINAKSYLIDDVEIIDSSGKINASALPEISITSVNVVASEVAQLALDVQVGDVAIRTDLNKSYVALNSDNVDMGDWQELLTPTDAVLSVNGETGAVTLDTDNINEGTTNLYDKTVAFTGGTNVTVGGTYPNFTLTDNSASSSDLTTHTGDSTIHFTEGSISLDNITEGTTNKFFTTTDETKLDYISVTQAVDLDALETASHSAVTLNASATTGGLSISGQEISNKAATNTQNGYMTSTLVSNIETNNAKVGVTDEISNVVEDTTPQLGGYLDLNSKGIKLTSQTVGGSDGDVVYMSGASTWSQTDSSAEATTKGMVGIRLSSTEVLLRGIYITTGLTAGSTYYMSETAGDYTTTAPSTSGSIVRIIGYALSTTQLLVYPSESYVENS